MSEPQITREDLVRSLKNARARLVRLRELQAPPIILENEKKLIARRERQIDELDEKEASDD